MNIIIRFEKIDDLLSISALTKKAFKDIEYSSHTEHLIVDALRQKEKLIISLVALNEKNEVVGHVAISPVRLSTLEQGWYGLGPISVDPNVQGQGIGTALMQRVIHDLKMMGAKGCVLLGDPNYYQKFGFKPNTGLFLADVPIEYFQALSFSENIPKAEVFYDDAFYISE